MPLRKSKTAARIPWVSGLRGRNYPGVICINLHCDVKYCNLEQRPLKNEIGPKIEPCGTPQFILICVGRAALLICLQYLSTVHAIGGTGWSSNRRGGGSIPT